MPLVWYTVLYALHVLDASHTDYVIADTLLMLIDEFTLNTEYNFLLALPKITNENTRWAYPRFDHIVSVKCVIEDNDVSCVK